MKRREGVRTKLFRKRHDPKGNKQPHPYLCTEVIDLELKRGDLAAGVAVDGILTVFSSGWIRMDGYYIERRGNKVRV